MMRKHLTLLLLAAVVVGLPGSMLFLTGCTGKERAVGPAPIAVPPAARVARGVVLDAAGNPLAGAIVEVIIGATVVARAVTGADGRFELRDFPEGEGIIRITSADGTAVLAVELPARGGIDLGRVRLVTAVVATAEPAPIAVATLPEASRLELTRAARTAPPPGETQNVVNVDVDGDGVADPVAVPVLVERPEETPPPALVLSPNRQMIDVAAGTSVPFRGVYTVGGGRQAAARLQTTATLEEDGTLNRGFAIPPTSEGVLLTEADVTVASERGRQQVTGAVVRVGRVLIIFQVSPDGRNSMIQDYTLRAPIGGKTGGFEFSATFDASLAGNTAFVKVVGSRRTIERFKVLELLGERNRAGLLVSPSTAEAITDLGEIRRLVCIVRIEETTPQQLREISGRVEREFGGR